MIPVHTPSRYALWNRENWVRLRDAYDRLPLTLSFDLFCWRVYAGELCVHRLTRTA